jgi:putative addiction module killer protein
MTRATFHYRALGGSVPFLKWLAALSDARARFKVRARIRRAAIGNLGDHRSVGGGVIELRIDHGPGYRVYVGLYGEELIVILCGGDKRNQSEDIALAHAYWSDFKKRL